MVTIRLADGVGGGALVGVGLGPGAHTLGQLLGVLLRLVHDEAELLVQGLLALLLQPGLLLEFY